MKIPPFAALALKENIKLGAMSTKIKGKIHTCFTSYFKF